MRAILYFIESKMSDFFTSWNWRFLDFWNFGKYSNAMTQEEHSGEWHNQGHVQGRQCQMTMTRNQQVSDAMSVRTCVDNVLHSLDMLLSAEQRGCDADLHDAYMVLRVQMMALNGAAGDVWTRGTSSQSVIEKKLELWGAHHSIGDKGETLPHTHDAWSAIRGGSELKPLRNVHTTGQPTMQQQMSHNQANCQHQNGRPNCAHLPQDAPLHPCTVCRRRTTDSAVPRRRTPRRTCGPTRSLEQKKLQF